MKHFKIVAWIVSLIFLPIESYSSQPIVVGQLIGQLGNQLFIIAATCSLAWDHHASPCFPDLINKKELQYNYKMLFSHFCTTHRMLKRKLYHYEEPCYSYRPIPYKGNMTLSGYFQSEKYFIHHKEKILHLFAPPKNILNDLEEKYSDLIQLPNTVAVHLRSYLKEDPTGSYHITYGMDYYHAAMELFPEETYFVIFTNDKEKAKKDFQNTTKKVRFIENESDIYDFYLMSLCKHNIIANSSFSWWAAYLNRNPNKIVVAPPLWFHPNTGLDTKDLLPESWIVVPLSMN